jgi:hypothetical protein
MFTYISRFHNTPILSFASILPRLAFFPNFYTLQCWKRYQAMDLSLLVWCALVYLAREAWKSPDFVLRTLWSSFLSLTELPTPLKMLGRQW